MNIDCGPLVDAARVAAARPALKLPPDDLIGQAAVFESLAEQLRKRRDAAAAERAQIIVDITQLASVSGMPPDYALKLFRDAGDGLGAGRLEQLRIGRKRLEGWVKVAAAEKEVRDAEASGDQNRLTKAGRGGGG